MQHFDQIYVVDSEIHVVDIDEFSAIYRIKDTRML